MKNKGFTIIELLAVIVILGVLSTLAVVSVTKYREDVRQRELINLHSTIEAAYNEYRSDIMLQGWPYLKEISFGTIDDDIFDKYFSDFTYDGARLTKEDFVNSKISLKEKGLLLEIPTYFEGKSEEQLIEDGVCLTKSEIKTINDEQTQINECVKENSIFQPSKEEIICILLKKEDQTLINDFADKDSNKSLCKYFSEGQTNE